MANCVAHFVNLIAYIKAFRDMIRKPYPHSFAIQSSEHVAHTYHQQHETSLRTPSMPLIT